MRGGKGDRVKTSWGMLGKALRGGGGCHGGGGDAVVTDSPTLFPSPAGSGAVARGHAGAPAAAIGQEGSKGRRRGARGCPQAPGVKPPPPPSQSTAAMRAGELGQGKGAWGGEPRRFLRAICGTRHLSVLQCLCRACSLAMQLHL